MVRDVGIDKVMVEGSGFIGKGPVRQGTVGGLPCKVRRGVLFFVRGTRKQEV